jgi:hypothetical protein
MNSGAKHDCRRTFVEYSVAETMTLALRSMADQCLEKDETHRGFGHSVSHQSRQIPFTR